jgi:hypothetical protein
MQDVHMKVNPEFLRQKQHLPRRKKIGIKLKKETG